MRSAVVRLFTKRRRSRSCLSGGFGFPPPPWTDSPLPSKIHAKNQFLPWAMSPTRSYRNLSKVLTFNPNVRERKESAPNIFPQKYTFFSRLCDLVEFFSLPFLPEDEERAAAFPQNFPFTRFFFLFFFLGCFLVETGFSSMTSRRCRATLAALPFPSFFSARCRFDIITTSPPPSSPAPNLECFNLPFGFGDPYYKGIEFFCPSHPTIPGRILPLLLRPLVLFIFIFGLRECSCFPLLSLFFDSPAFSNSNVGRNFSDSHCKFFPFKLPQRYFR